jgi:hypothetical protein
VFRAIFVSSRTRSDVLRDLATDDELAAKLVDALRKT